MQQCTPAALLPPALLPRTSAVTLAPSPNPATNSNEKHYTSWLHFLWNSLQYFTTVPSTLIRNYLSEHFLHGFFSPPILIEDSFPKATLTKSFSTRKEERSTKTHVGIMKNTAWQPSMFSNRRWCIRESRNTWWRAPLQLCPNHPPFSVTVTTSRNRLIKYANECWYGVNFQWGHPKKQMSLWKSGVLTGDSQD